MPAYDKLSIIIDCLLLKGQHVPTVADDGSREWNVCSAAYENAVKHLTHDGNWSFATALVTLARTGDADDTNWQDAYARPTEALHVIWVHLDDAAPLDGWTILGNRILVNAGGSGNTTDVTAKILVVPAPEDMPPMFVSALQHFIWAAIESGLRHDATASLRHQQAAELAAQNARTRIDQQTPKRAMFVPSIRADRVRRRG